MKANQETVDMCPLCAHRPFRTEGARRDRVAKELKEEKIRGWKSDGGGFVFTSPCGRWKTYCAVDGDYFYISFGGSDMPPLDVPRLRLSATGSTIRGAVAEVMKKIRVHCKPLRLPWETIRTGFFPSGLDKDKRRAPKLPYSFSDHATAGLGSAAGSYPATKRTKRKTP